MKKDTDIELVVFKYVFAIFAVLAAVMSVAAVAAMIGLAVCAWKAALS